jgi:hypothetical protein
MVVSCRSVDGNLHTEDPLTEYEKIRVVNMMKNNKLFQRLGLGQLKIMMTARTANNKEGCPQKSRYLYDGEDNDGSDEEVTMVLNYYFLSFLTLSVITFGFLINLICIRLLYCTYSGIPMS